MSAIAFTHDALCEAAAAKAGADDFGSDSYRAALGPLLHSIEHEAGLHERGRREMWDRIVAALANRLTLVAWEKAEPDLAAAPVGPPLVVLGLPRTGSSILHETLAAAPGMRTPLTWQVRDFALAHQVADARSDERVRRIDATIAQSNERAPGYAAIHYSDAYVPMECVALTILDLVSIQFATIARAPTYREFLLSLDARGAYRWHRRALGYLQANRPQARWVLKAPMHSLYIDALMETYPDARLVQTHRDPMAVIPSNVSLHATLRRAWSDQDGFEGEAARDVAVYTAKAIQRAVDYRRDHPEVDARIHDVAFKAFMADQAGALSRLYDHCGLAFTDEARQAMLGYLANRPRDKYGKHRYSIEEFGLTATELNTLFAGYAERFQVFI